MSIVAGPRGRAGDPVGRTAAPTGSRPGARSGGPGGRGALPAEVTADVVVVGGGGSGLAAAIEAATAGAEVVVLERGAELRGSTGRSVGSIAAAGTPDQRRIGVQDTTAEHLRDYRILSGALADGEDEALVRLLIEHAPDTLAWLRGMGMEFFGPVGEPPHSAPRLHNILPGSRAYIYHLARRARSLGIRVDLGVRATGLVREEDSEVAGSGASHPGPGTGEDRGGAPGRVTGVVAEGPDGPRTYRARRGVVLAAGDFSASRELRSSYISDTVAGYAPVNPYAMGDAQRMVEDVGGRVLNGEVFDVPSIRLAPPPSDGLFGLLQRIPPHRALTVPMREAMRRLPRSLVRLLMMGFVTTYLSPREEMFADGALLVDRSGRLVGSEEERVSLTVAGLGPAGGHLLGDADLFDRYSAEPNHVATAPGVAYAYMPDFRRTRPDVYVEADSIEELARRLAVSPVSLARSVAEGNARAAAAGRPVVARPPFFTIGPLQALLIQTNGGIALDPRLRVLDGEGRGVPGLYAAGNAGQAGLALFGHGHHLGWAFTSGRAAGRNAALDGARDGGRGTGGGPAS